MDRFSKSCHLIPLKNLPTAMETAEQMFNHMFRYFGIPEEIVSDSIHFQSMEELPQAPRCDCQSIVWVPPADQRADGEKDPGNRSFPANLLPRPPAILEPVYWLGRVRPELPFVNNPLDSLPSSACSVSTHLCSPGMRNHQMYLQ